MLDVGSGSSPHPAADVLLEKYVDTRHRYDNLVVDRDMVLADATKMPFRDKTFDFVIAFHVLEHMRDPVAFLNELQRVGKAGYIETPNAIFERLHPYDVHLSEVMHFGGGLIINMKSSENSGDYLGELNLFKSDVNWKRLFYNNPEYFHVQYFWKDEIFFKVLNPTEKCLWFLDPPLLANGNLISKEELGFPSLMDWRAMGLYFLRKFYKSFKNRKYNLFEILVCPSCHGSLRKEIGYFKCQSCSRTFSSDPLLDFNVT